MLLMSQHSSTVYDHTIKLEVLICFRVSTRVLDMLRSPCLEPTYYFPGLRNREGCSDPQDR